MAIGSGDGSIILSTKVDTKGLKAGLGSIKTITKAVTAGFVAIADAATTAAVEMTKTAVSAYAEFEQLSGGAELLFGEAYDYIMKKSEDAFATVQLSQNEYLKQANGFAVGLKTSLGGNEMAAAQLADKIINAEADVIAATGQAQDAVQNAFNGIMKSNYLMVDNLLIGITPTKEGYQEMIDKVNAWHEANGRATKYHMGNLADEQAALVDYIEMVGMKGYAEREASGTIEGSLAMTKSAWENLMIAMGRGDGIEKAINNMVFSLSKFMENIVPVVERSLMGIGQLISQAAPLLVETVVRALIQAIPSLVSAVYKMIVGLAKGIRDGIMSLFTGKTTEITAQLNNDMSAVASNTSGATDGMEELADETKEAGKQAKKSLAAFDDLQILADNSSAGSAEKTDIAGGGGGFGGGVSSAVEEAETEVGGFATVMQEIFAKISEAMMQVWNSEPVQAFVNASKTILGTLWTFITTMWQDIQINTATTWQNINGDIAGYIENLTTLWTMFWNDVNVAVQKWGNPIIESIRTLFNSIWQTAIDPAIQLITGAWEGFTSILVELWDKYGAPLLDNIGEFVKTTIDLFQTIYDNILEPIITPFLETLSYLWDEHISDLVYSIGEFVMKLVNAALEIYNKFIAPLLTYLVELLAPIWKALWTDIFSFVREAVGIISDLLKGIIQSCTHLIDFLVGVFTGDWDKAWNAIVNTFTTLWETLQDTVKRVVNLIIGGLNKLIDGINEISFDVPDWLGGGHFGFDIPRIPKLAQGAVIPPNREFLAVLGDQKQGMNIEAPLQTIVDAFNIALAQNGGNGGNTTVVLEIDGREFGHAVIEQGQRESKRLGTRLVMA